MKAYMVKELSTYLTLDDSTHEEVIVCIDLDGETWILFSDGSFGMTDPYPRPPIDLSRLPFEGWEDTVKRKEDFAEIVMQIRRSPDMDIIPLVSEWYFGFYDTNKGEGKLADRFYED